MTRPVFLALSGILLCAAPALAHAPYEVNIGSFTRSDGVIITASEYYVDDILRASPVSIRFHTPDGAIVAETEFTSDTIVVRMSLRAIDVYRFESDWVPFSRTIQRFDGFTLTDITSPKRSANSLLIHTRAYLVDYLVVATIAGMWVGGWRLARAIPKQGLLAGVRVLGFVAVALSALIYLLIVLFLIPVSPVILGIFIGAGAAAWFELRRFMRW